MRIVVFGATGKTGRHTWRRALDAGHRVTAFGRSIDGLTSEEPTLDVAKGDVLDASTVAAAVADNDGAIICLGSSGLRDKTTLASGTRNIVDALSRSGGGRLVVLSAAGAGESWEQIPLSSRLVFKTMLRNILADHEAQEAIVTASTLDWTIVRAAVLKDDPATGSYHASNTDPIVKINRADLAIALVDQLDDTSQLRTAISVTATS